MGAVLLAAGNAKGVVSAGGVVAAGGAGAVAAVFGGMLRFCTLAVGGAAAGAAFDGVGTAGADAAGVPIFTPKRCKWCAS